MKYSYYAVFEYTSEDEVKKNVYAIAIYFPDLRGCVSCANDIEHGIEMAKDVLTLYIETLFDDKKTLPTPSDKKDLEKKLGENEKLFKITVEV